MCVDSEDEGETSAEATGEGEGEGEGEGAGEGETSAEATGEGEGKGEGQGESIAWDRCHDIVIDVRSPLKYKASHASCAVNMPRPSWGGAGLGTGGGKGKETMATFKKAYPVAGSNIAVHCSTGFAAEQVRQILLKAGYAGAQVTNLQGWTDSTDPVSWTSNKKNIRAACRCEKGYGESEGEGEAATQAKPTAPPCTPDKPAYYGDTITGFIQGATILGDDAALDTFQKCADECMAVDECKAFHFQSNNAKCALKSAGVAGIKTSQNWHNTYVAQEKMPATKGDCS
jgi:rhodanese-related sulfurtransferase